jgi:SsrA-binding protein
MVEAKVKIIADNRRAGYEYALSDRFEAGIVLVGTEIKSLRSNSCNIKDAYVMVRGGEAYILNMNIAPYQAGNIFNHDPLRTRKLLLNKKEIIKLSKRTKEDGYTLIPTKVYFSKGFVKLEFAIAKGKKLFDKRESEKQKSMEKSARKSSKEAY